MLQFFRRRRGLIALLAMTIMTATAVGFFGEPFFLGAAGPMILFCRWGFFTCGGVNIDRAELLAAFPAPGTATASPDLEGASSLEATCKDIVTGGVFEGPTLTPWTLFRICGHSLMYGA